MQSHDPIRLEDFASRRPAQGFEMGRVSRAEAGRQFRFSLALVVTLAVGTLAVASTLPTDMSAPQMAQNGAQSSIVTTVVR